MPLVPMTELLHTARAGGYGVGYFEAWNLESLEAVRAAAEAEAAPVILGFGAMMVDGGWLDAGGVEALGALGRTVAARATVPTSLIFNEAQTFDQAVRAIEAGFNAVMLDTSAWSDDEAIAAVQRLVALARPRGVTVEAELGRLPDATLDGGIDASGARLTDPDRARDFIDATGADCLAVSVGNVHLLTAHRSPLDLDRLDAIHAQVDVPLVLHGGTGLPPDAIPRAVAGGVAKFNVGTVLKRAYLQALRETVAQLAENVDPHAALGSHKSADLLRPSTEAMTAKVCELIRLYGGAGRAR